MNSGLVWFVGAMLAVVVAAGLGVWWVGPTLAHLAFLDERRSQPYTVLDLAQPAASEVYDARYLQPMGELVRSEEGAVFERYRLEHVLSGAVADEWQDLRLLKFPSATDLVQVLTSSPYRLLERNLADTKLLKLGSFTAPVENWRDVIVVWLVDQTVESPIEDPLAALLHLSAQSEGRVVWDATVDALEPGPSWNRVVVIDFVDEKSAFAWLRNDSIATERALSKGRVDRLALFVFST